MCNDPPKDIPEIRLILAAVAMHAFIGQGYGRESVKDSFYIADQMLKEGLRSFAIDDPIPEQAPEPTIPVRRPHDIADDLPF